MGVLVYALNASGLAAAGSSQHDTLSNLYQLALLDRSTSMRQMIGELAMAKKLTYRETSDKYGALIATARKDVSLASYQAVDDFETQTMRQANALMARLQTPCSPPSVQKATSTHSPQSVSFNSSWS